MINRKIKVYLKLEATEGFAIRQLHLLNRRVPLLVNVSSEAKHGLLGQQ
jgi:hypothetical protein